MLVLPGFRINLKHASSCDLQAVYFWTTFLPIRCILSVNFEFRYKSLHYPIQFKRRKNTSTTNFSIPTITLKVFNTYNIADKLKHGFTSITTYFCTDDVHSDNHQPVFTLQILNTINSVRQISKDQTCNYLKIARIYAQNMCRSFI